MSTIKTKNIKRGTVCHTSWLQFLNQITRWEEDTRLINGQAVKSSSHTRAMHRWEKEGASPIWWKVDDFLCQYELTWTDYEIWCFVEGQNLWEKHPPMNWEIMT